MTPAQILFPDKKPKADEVITPLTPPHVAERIRAKHAPKPEPEPEMTPLDELEALANENALKRPTRTRK